MVMSLCGVVLALVLHPQVLYRFIDGICATLITRNLDDYMHAVGGAPVDPEKAKVKAKRRIPPADLYGLYATAMKTLADWPRSFFEFLDAFSPATALELDPPGCMSNSDPRINIGSAGAGMVRNSPRPGCLRGGP